MTGHPVWDAPSRFIHWCLPIGIGLMWWTGETGRMELHSYVAYVLLTLVTTRLALGFVGSYHSRFRNFIVGPSSVIGYLREGGHFVGHNPLGALSTLALLLLVLRRVFPGSLASMMCRLMVRSLMLLMVGSSTWQRSGTTPTGASFNS